MTSLRKRVTVGLLGAAVVAGGGIAYAATQSSDPRDAYLNDVAKRLNVTPEKLREAMKGASLDRVEQAVKDGKLTREQADAVRKKIEAGGGVGPIAGPGFFGREREDARRPRPALRLQAVRRRARRRRRLPRPIGRRPAQADRRRQVARRRREGAEQGRRRPEEGHHRRGAQAPERGRQGRQPHPGAGRRDRQGARRPCR